MKTRLTHWLRKNLFLFLILVTSLTSSCGNRSPFAAQDTKEGDEFIEQVTKDWSEVKEMTQIEYWTSQNKQYDTAYVQKRISEVTEETTSRFKQLYEARKLSQSQHERYLAVLKEAANVPR